MSLIQMLASSRVEGFEFEPRSTARNYPEGVPEQLRDLFDAFEGVCGYREEMQITFSSLKRVSTREFGDVWEFGTSGECAFIAMTATGVIVRKLWWTSTKTDENWQISHENLDGLLCSNLSYADAKSLGCIDLKMQIERTLAEQSPQTTPAQRWDAGLLRLGNSIRHTAPFLNKARVSERDVLSIVDANGSEVMWALDGMGVSYLATPLRSKPALFSRIGLTRKWSECELRRHAPWTCGKLLAELLAADKAQSDYWIKEALVLLRELPREMPLDEKTMHMLSMAC
jgi:hypothetical protein